MAKVFFFFGRLDQNISHVVCSHAVSFPNKSSATKLLLRFLRRYIDQRSRGYFYVVYGSAAAAALAKRKKEIK
jgi:hypothetical protein